MILNDLLLTLLSKNFRCASSIVFFANGKHLVSSLSQGSHVPTKGRECPKKKSV